MPSSTSTLHTTQCTAQGSTDAACLLCMLGTVQKHAMLMAVLMIHAIGCFQPYTAVLAHILSHPAPAPSPPALTQKYATLPVLTVLPPLLEPILTLLLPLLLLLLLLAILL
jgi:hypothetical protein